MRILLIAPPIEDFYFTPQRAYPLGILYLASSLAVRGFTVKVLNALETNKKITLKIPDDFTYLKRYYQPNRSPFCLFSNYYHFGLTYPEIEAVVRQFRPALVGISSNFSPYFDTSRQVARIVKYVDARIPVVMGGRFPTSNPELVLGEKSVDFVIRGEGEEAFCALCSAVAEGRRISRIKGLCYKVNQRLHIASAPVLIKKLDALPFPDRRLIDYQRYVFGGTVMTSLISSRGCVLGCKFCAIQEKFRSRSADNVFKEIVYCYSLGIRHFNFEDDNININPHFGKVLDHLIDNFAGKITVSFMNGLLAQGLHAGLRKKLLAAGLTHIDLSLVTSNRKVRLKTERPSWQKSIFDLSSFMARRGIAPTVHFIIALPGQRFIQALADVKLLAKKTVKLGPSIFYPVIESGFFQELKERFGFSAQGYRLFRSSCACFDRYMSRDEIFTIFYLSRVVNFVKDLIDNGVIQEDTLSSFLLTVPEKTNSTNDNLVTVQRIERERLGVILLKKLIEEKSVYRVEEKQKNGQFYYAFFRDDFISAHHIRLALEGLSVRGLSGRAIKI
ncbi:MAG: radical SAM protein [Candidatus Omnitrophota bacterium]